MDFEDPVEMQRVYHRAHMRGGNTLSHLYDEPDPMIDAEDLAQEAVIKLWGHVRSKGEEYVEKPHQWASQIAYWSALKKQRIGFHEKNRKASEWLDVYIEDFVAEHLRMPSEIERADLAEQVIVEMRREHPKQPPQDEFDQLERTVFLDDDEVRSELEMIPGSPTPGAPVMTSVSYVSLAEEAMDLAHDRASLLPSTDRLPEITQLLLHWLSEGFDLDHVGRTRVTSFGEVERLTGRHRRGIRSVIEEAKTCIRQAAEQTLCPGPVPV